MIKNYSGFIAMSLLSIYMMAIVSGYVQDNGSVVYVVLLMIFYGIYVAYKEKFDLLSPIIIIEIAIVVRLILPGVMLESSDPHLQIGFFSASLEYWHMGRNLALLSACLVMSGWFFMGMYAPPVKNNILPAKKLNLIPVYEYNAAVLFYIVGLALMILWLTLTYSNPFNAIFSGNIRDRNIRVDGVSRYVVLGSLFLHSSCLMLQAFALCFLKKKSLYVILPGIFVLIFMAPFGGRVNALAPLILGLVGLYYYHRNEVTTRKIILYIFIIASFVGVFSMVVQNFRGSSSEDIDLFSSDGLWRYLEFSIWNEISMLHPYVIASMMEPGIIVGDTYKSIGGYVFQLFSLSGEAVGTYMVEMLMGSFSGVSWGIHTGLFVDVYMNSGLYWSIFASILYGVAMRIGYIIFETNNKKNYNGILYYPIFLWGCFWVYFESITFLGSFFNTLIIIFAIKVVGVFVVNENR